MKRNSKIVSVIDIGSSFVRMGIYQTGKNGTVETLDMLEHPTRLGHEVFTEGRIRAETVRELTAALQGFSRVMKGYGVSEYRAVATTALREAENRPYVVDQLKTQNNLLVGVLEDGEESALMYGELLRSPLMKKNALLAYIGTGSVGVAAAEEGAIIRCSSIRLGFMKLGEILRELEDQTTHFHVVLEEYVETRFRRLNRLFGRFGMGRLLLTGRELETIAPLCGAEGKQGAYLLRRDQLDALYDRIKDLTVSAAARELSLPEETAGQVLPMLAIYRKILSLTQAEEIVAPCMDLMDILAAQLLLPARKLEFEAVQRNGTLSCARRLASFRHADVDHAERTAGYAALLFDKLKKLHGISAKRRTLLECAALLHEIGENVNVKSSADAAYDLIRQSYIYGLNEEETVLTAEIVRCAGGDEASGMPKQPLSEKQRLLVDKLAAILMLANSLDESHAGKIEELKLRLDEKALTVTAGGGAAQGAAVQGTTAHRAGEMLLEKWAFGECAPFFENVFGVRPVFINRSRLL